MIPLKYLIGHTKKEGHEVYMDIGYDQNGDLLGAKIYTDEYPVRKYLANYPETLKTLFGTRGKFEWEGYASWPFLETEERQQITKATSYDTPKAAIQAVIASKLIKRLPLNGRKTFQDVPKPAKIS